ncbi:helical backbone metal receptor [Rhizocola hellebori]|uniref:helical backbone metal receptor n=1 Tax=Rhizocola hellebori TaxID=1392758 RepID=UPI001942B668|nr:helical backbone metal receptor [Rhizocola hellebori]
MRVVSLVPSLTEAVALTAPGMLVGATDWCVHPAGLDVARVGGSKYPDLAAVLALRPDLVLMNVEENKESDAEALRAAGLRLHVTYPRTVDQALAELGELFEVLGVARPGWLDDAVAAWDFPPITPVRAAVVPVWRKPWVVLGSDTFAGDMLLRLGIGNVFGADPQRYPRPSLSEILARKPELAVLPDEPYKFTSADGPFRPVPYALVSGRHLTWYGPSLAEAPLILNGQLRVLSDP